MTRGAGWAVTFNGETQTGTASEHGSASGSFQMPDLGNQAQSLDIQAEITHQPGADDPGNLIVPGTVHYVPPPARAPESPADQQASGSQAPATGRGLGGSDGSGRGGSGRGARPEGGNPSPSSVAAPATVSAPVGEVGAPRGSSVSDPVGTREQTAETASTSVPDRVVESLTASTRVGPAEVPNLALGLAAILFVLGTALAAYLVFLFSNGPDPRAAIRFPAPPGPDPLETELQEILAEEMARSLLTQLSLNGDGAGAKPETPQASETSAAVRIRNP
jgi:hypothetical protein